MYKCLIEKEEFKTIRGLLNHIRKHNLTSKCYYDKFFKTDKEDICNLKECINMTKFNNIIKGYNKFCSDICANKYPEKRAIVSERFVNDPEKLKISLTKQRKTLENDSSIMKRSIEKRNITLKKKYGENLYQYFSKKSKKAFSSMTDKQVEERTLKAMRTKEITGNHGGRSYYKPYVLFGENINIQGYENVVLDILQKKYSFKNGEILSGKSHIWFKYNNERMYFPDIFIPSHNLIIEVKSTYTFFQDLKNNMDKKDAVIKSGKSFVFIILEGNKVRKGELDKCEKLLDWAISSQASNPDKVVWYDEGSTTSLIEGVDSKWNRNTEILV